MKTFKIDKYLEIVCEWKKTRNGFKHEATLLRNGREMDKTKICYSNRTWESFEFESVIKKLLDKTTLLSDRQKVNFLKRASGREEAKTNSQFGSLAAIAKLGEVFHAGDQKATNDWKARMLKAGLENKGLVMPDDWDVLAEDEKEKRLEGALGVLA